MEIGDVGRWLDEHDVSIVQLYATGIDGHLMGKHLSRTKFERCVPEGVCVTDFVFSFDLGGTPQLGWWAEWRRDALGDIYVRPDLDTLTMSAEPGVAMCLGDFTDLDGIDLPVCPRSLLRAQRSALHERGFDARAAFELEFFVFDQPLAYGRARGFRGLVPLGGIQPKPGYVMQRAPEMLPFIRAAAARLDAIGIPWEAVTDEGGQGQLELNIAPADPLTAADYAVRAKQVLREVAHEQHRSVTFMAKPFPDLALGSGLHMHLSLQRDGVPAFVDESGEPTATLRHWVGGYLATIDGATSILTPTINSFRRQVDFAAVPTTPTWAEDNKGVAVRTITRKRSLARAEHRLASADANPYLVMATLLAGGIAGLDQQLEPPEPAVALPWGLPDDHPHLPHSITTAAAALDHDKLLRNALGDTFVHHWVESRKWEWLMFHTGGGDPDAAGTTDWELVRYFEWV